MEKKDFDKIITTLQRAKLSDEEKVQIYSCLGIEELVIEDDVIVKAVESFLKLASDNNDLCDKYSKYIDEYHDLSDERKKRVCRYAYKYFLTYGAFDIDVICTILIPDEASRASEVVPIQKVKKYEDPVIAAIKENSKHYGERPIIDFSGIRYDIEKK